MGGTAVELRLLLLLPLRRRLIERRCLIDADVPCRTVCVPSSYCRSKRKRGGRRRRSGACERRRRGGWSVKPGQPISRQLIDDGALIAGYLQARVRRLGRGYASLPPPDGGLGHKLRAIQVWGWCVVCVCAFFALAFGCGERRPHGRFMSRKIDGDAVIQTTVVRVAEGDWARLPTSSSIGVYQGA